MTERSATVLHDWVLARSGVTLVFVLIVFAVVVQPLGSISPGLPSGLAFAAYLYWLLIVSQQGLRRRGRRWTHSAFAALPFVVLFAFSLLVVPLMLATEDGLTPHDAIGRPVKYVAAIALVSYVIIWDHIAHALSKSGASGVVRVARYVGMVVLAFMPPFAVLWVQHEIREDGA